MCDLYYYDAARVNTGSNDGIYALNDEELDKMMVEMEIEETSTDSHPTSPPDSVDGSCRGDCRECGDHDCGSVCPQTEFFAIPPYLCEHNCWDNLRTKKDLVTMRCRDCSMQWKAMKDFVESKKCEDFAKNCCENENCDKLHIFRFKLPAKKRGKLLKKKAEALAAYHFTQQQNQQVALPYYYY